MPVVDDSTSITGSARSPTPKSMAWYLQRLDAEETRLDNFRFFNARDLVIFSLVAGAIVTIPSAAAHLVTGPVAGLTTFLIMLCAVLLIARRAAKTFDDAKGALRRQCVKTCWTFLVDIGGQRMHAARTSCDRLLAYANAGPSTPESLAAVRTVTSQLAALVWSFADIARHATEHELKTLTADLFKSVEQLGVFADENRRALLHLSIMDFQTNQRMIDIKTAPAPLSSI